MDKTSSQVMNYFSSETPSDYKCHNCGMKGCKLWREYCLAGPMLLCLDCAATKTGIDASTVNDDGTSPDIHSPGCKTDRIGDELLPAIPTPDNQKYCHHVIPIGAFDWWYNLPLRVQQ